MNCMPSYVKDGSLILGHNGFRWVEQRCQLTSIWRATPLVYCNTRPCSRTLSFDHVSKAFLSDEEGNVQAIGLDQRCRSTTFREVRRGEMEKGLNVCFNCNIRVGF